jgi:rod shape-determining protein MreC
MRFNPGRSELSTEKKSLVLVLILFVNLLLISSQIILKNRQSLLQTVIANMVTPLQLAFQKTSDFISGKVERYFFLGSIFKRYQVLKKEHVDLRMENYALKRELRDLRMQAAVRKEFDRFLLATVISIDVNFPYDSLTIDRGTHAGLMENNVVLNSNAELVGKIVGPLTPFSAQVRLITSSIGGTGAYIENNMMEGLLKGDNRAECSFQYLLANKPVRLGDRVITSGTDLIYPDYIPIGRVSRIGEGYLTQEISVRPYFVEKPLKKLVVLLNE